MNGLLSALTEVALTMAKKQPVHKYSGDTDPSSFASETFEQKRGSFTIERAGPILYQGELPIPDRSNAMNTIEPINEVEETKSKQTSTKGDSPGSMTGSSPLKVKYSGFLKSGGKNESFKKSFILKVKKSDQEEEKNEIK